MDADPSSERSVPHPHPRAERHRSHRSGWLRAAVLGADDGIVSTASLMIGVVAADGGRSAVLTAGVAGIVAGALSMATGEYVSVSSQRDVQRADLAREADELERTPHAELLELVRIYERRGLSRETATQVAHELSAGDRLRVHARDELGLDIDALASPFLAAWTSALAFTLGGLVAFVTFLIAPADARGGAIAVVALLALAVLGALGARLGGAPKVRAAARVLVGGGLAMLATALIGRLIGASL